MGSPWVEPGPVVAVRAFLRLAEGKDITLDELHSLIARTPSATKARPDGFWRYGAKKPLEDARSTSPGATTNLRDLTARGLTEHGARAIVAADLRALEARIPLEYLTAYRRAMAAGRWGKRAADVRVSSVHGVKGGEADGVVMGMSCTAMPLRAMDHPHRREEETRIAYVAMTRAFKRFYGVPVPGASFEWNLCRS
jgi:superfamily I DNA/RNA helicase